MSDEQLTPTKVAENFCRHWSIHSTMSSLGMTMDETLDILLQDEAQDYINQISQKLEQVYKRMPVHLFAGIVMKILTEATTATEKSQALTAFTKWVDLAPPPTDTESVERLVEAITNAS